MGNAHNLLRFLQTQAPLLIVLSTGAKLAEAQNFYSTEFSNSENPLSEGGRWTNGKADGLDWQDVQTMSGFATFTQPNVSEYDDSTAILTGTWGPDQYVRTVVHKPAGDSYPQEIEIRLRSSISAHRITGYEVLNAGQIVRWNGPLGDFTVLPTEGPHGILNDGDVFEAQIVGNVITVFVNGVQVNRAVDNVFTSGNPGIGFFTRNPSPPPFGISSFTASDRPLESEPTQPYPPTDLEVQ